VIKKERKVRQTPLAQERTPGPSTQFKSTPRFTFPSTPRPTASQTLPRATPIAARYLTPASKTPKDRDVIESFSDNDVQDSIEAEDQDLDQEFLSADEEDDYKIDKRVLKRRRISSSSEPEVEECQEKDDELPPHPPDTQDSVSSSLPILSSPAAPRRPISTTAPRFITSTPAPPATPQPSTAKTTFLKPHRFRPPDPSESAQGASDPLPEQFSPHRKGQNYVHGGLAAEVRDWLVNIESSIPANQAGRRGDEWLVRVLVDEVSGGGAESQARMTMIRGKQVHFMGGEDEMVDTAGKVRVMLAGEGQATGLQKGSKVEAGKTIGIKGPVWEVVIEEEKWGVGVDWKVLP
jgi:hypothetical protein